MKARILQLPTWQEVIILALIAEPFITNLLLPSQLDYPRSILFMRALIAFAFAGSIVSCYLINAIADRYHRQFLTKQQLAYVFIVLLLITLATTYTITYVMPEKVISFNSIIISLIIPIAAIILITSIWYGLLRKRHQ